jgi:transposase-like protein
MGYQENNGGLDSLMVASGYPDPQVPDKVSRRRFSKAYKLGILRQAAACSRPGEVGALLRREGLYASALTAFRRQQAQGRLQERDAQVVARGRRERANERQRLVRQVAQLENENRKLKTIVEFQKKMQELLDVSLGQAPSNGTGA